MDFIYDENQNGNKNKKNKLISRILLILIILLTLAVIGIIAFMLSLGDSTLKVYIDEKAVQVSDSTFIIDNDKVYVSIKDISGLLGYEVHNGEYKIYSEDTNKCYVESSKETASFFLNSNKISKVEPNTTDDYENYTISEPVKNINGNLYILSEGIEIAFNVKFQYDMQKNNITIQTLPYLVEYYSNIITGYGYQGMSDNFNNQKAIRHGLFVVQNTSSRYGVIDINNKEIIGARYSNIEFSENTGEFFVTNSQGKVGIMLNNGSTKINLLYEDIKLLDRKLGLYLVKSNNKYGVIDEKENFVIHMEYDTIGIDTSLYPTNNIENQYLLFDNVIPVKQGNKWGLFDKKGKVLIDMELDSIGCTRTTVRDKVVNNLLIIPDIEGIVICKNGKYGIVNSTGKVLVPCAVETVYSTTSAGINSYNMLYIIPATNQDEKDQEITYDVLDYLRRLEELNNQNNENSNSNSNITNNVNQNNTTSENTQEAGNE